MRTAITGAGILAVFAFVTQTSGAQTPRSRTVKSLAELVVGSAVDQVSTTKFYDASYVPLAYPMGDVPKDRGACTDVVIRAYRAANIDLQQRVHDDMKRNWNLYPRYKGIKKPDSNIDHRRTKNLRVFFSRFGTSLTIDTAKSDSWKPGDIITWDLGGGLDHIGIVSSTRAKSGRLMVIHNIGGMHFDDSMNAFQKVTGHYRYPRERS